MSGSPDDTTTDVVTPRYGSRVGTWGPGAFDNDDALDLLDALSGQGTAARRQVLEQIFREAREHPENLNFTLGSAEVQQKSDADLKAATEKGVKTGNGMMPGYAGKLTPEQIDGLVMYIRSLKK